MTSKVGFISNCLEGSLEEKLKIAAKLGYNTLEVACWPKGSAKQCDIDASNIAKVDLKKIKLLEKEYNVEISTLVFYENMLEADLLKRGENVMHLLNVIELAQALEVPYVGTYIGKDVNHGIGANLVMMKQIFDPILEFAAKRGVTVLIENCPMPTWSLEGNPSTISYTPELLTAVFEILPQDNFGLNYDPSHLYWQRIDYLKPLQQFKKRIKSIHVKDVTLNGVAWDRYGIYGKYLNKKHQYDFGYYQDTLVGYGDINWQQFFAKLKNLGFTGPIQIEYKNSNGYGKILDSKRGLKLSRDYLTEVMETREV